MVFYPNIRFVMTNHHALKDMSGKEFGRLTAMAEFGRDAHGRSLWLCLCTCGGSRVVAGMSLRQGSTRSCGCLAAENPGGVPKHGRSKTPEHRAWTRMWERCTNENHPAYDKYRGRTPPAEWRDFRVFLRELGERPSPRHSLDRVKNHLPYGPGNCRWATSSQQARNRGSNILVNLGGEVVCLAEACDRLSLKRATVANRWFRHKDMRLASWGLLTLATA